MPATDEQSQARRPAAVLRHPSSSSQVSQSPSEPSTSHRGPGAHKPQRHVVGHHGHGRLGSTRNLNKLNKLTSANDGAAAHSSTPKHHARTKSGEINGSYSNSLRPAMKRNASAFVISRNTSHSALKKNHSSGHLPRHGSSKNVMKTARHQPLPLTKRTRSHRSERSEASDSSPPDAPHPTVRFALGDEGGHGEEPEHEDNEWTEESASASPHTTRSSTPARQSSLVAEGGSMAARAEASQAQVTTSRTSLKTPPSPRASEPDRSTSIQDFSGSSSYRPTRLPDADIITSRILQRTPSHNPVPKVSTISATATPEGHGVGSLAHSQGSTLTLADGTPGRDLVSRFIDTTGSGGTPKDGSNFPVQQNRSTQERGELELHKRNKSTPNLANRHDDSPASTHSRAVSHRSGANTPTTGELPPSRTQQKLLLQRASSIIDPPKHIPAVLPRSGASQLIGHGVSFSSGEGVLPPQIQNLFHQTAKEYKVVRRYKNPVAEAITRLSEIPGAPRPKSTSDRTNSKGKNQVNGKGKGPQVNGQGQKHREEPSHREGHGPGHSRADTGGGSIRKGAQGHGHKSRVSFDLPGRPQPLDDDEDERHSFQSSEHGGRRDEAYEICRRLWEIGEAAEGG